MQYKDRLTIASQLDQPIDEKTCEDYKALFHTFAGTLEDIHNIKTGVNIVKIFSELYPDHIILDDMNSLDTTADAEQKPPKRFSSHILNNKRQLIGTLDLNHIKGTLTASFNDTPNQDIRKALVEKLWQLNWQPSS